MAKRVMRSNRRTQRRRGSQLKQRKKRSKLLKRTLTRTLKRRNSFRKKNTYKRRKTNMKRGGRPRAETDNKSYNELNEFVTKFNDGIYMKLSTRLSIELTELLLTNTMMKVARNTLMRDGVRFCEIDRVDKTELFVYFKDDDKCSQTWKKTSKLLGRKHGISLTHLMNNYIAEVRGNETHGYYLQFTRKKGKYFFRDD